MSSLKLIDGSLGESFAVEFFSFKGRQSTFNGRADVQEQLIASVVTVSVRQAVVGGLFITIIIA